MPSVLDEKQATTTPTSSTTPPPLQFPRHSSSSFPTRHSTSKKSLACSGSSLRRPKPTHSHPANSVKVDQSQVTLYYTNLGDSSTTISAGASGDLFWDTSGEYKKGEQLRKDGASRLIRSKSNLHKIAKPSMDKDLEIAKKSPQVPAGGNHTLLQLLLKDQQLIR